MTTQNNYISQPVPALVRMFFERCHSSDILPGISCECYDCEWYIESDLFCCSIELAHIDASANAIVLAAIPDAARRWLRDNTERLSIIEDKHAYGCQIEWWLDSISSLSVEMPSPTGFYSNPSDTRALLTACLMVKDQMEKKE